MDTEVVIEISKMYIVTENKTHTHTKEKGKKSIRGGPKPAAERRADGIIMRHEA